MKKRHTPRAQTTRLASFEPFSVVATFYWHTLPVAYFTGYNLYKTLVSIKKHEEKKGKNTPGVQTTSFRRAALYFVIRIYNLKTVLKNTRKKRKLT